MCFHVLPPAKTCKSSFSRAALQLVYHRSSLGCFHETSAHEHGRHFLTSASGWYTQHLHSQWFRDVAMPNFDRIMCLPAAASKAIHRVLMLTHILSAMQSAASLASMSFMSFSPLFRAAIYTLRSVSELSLALSTWTECPLPAS